MNYYEWLESQYYNWIESLNNLLIEELRELLGKDFIKDKGMALGASCHSKYMMEKKNLCYAPEDFMEPALEELVETESCVYNQPEVEQAIGRLAYKFLTRHDDYHASLRYFQMIGAGIAIEEVKPMELVIYAIIRLALKKR